MPNKKINLLNFDREQLREYFMSLDEKSFHANQVIQWIHQYGITDFSQMSNLSLKLRKHLADCAVVMPPQVEKIQRSKDGTQKWLLRLEDDAFIEMVFIPEEDRGTLCVSSQVGCPLACKFCATSYMGFKRNLTIAEIIGQVWLAVREFSKDSGKHDRSVTNVVLMGMGEPLLNLDNVIPALNLMMDDLAYSFSKYRVTVSTVGIVPAMKKLQKRSDASLAVSLHAPNNALRTQIMPINETYSLDMLIPVCKAYFANEPKRKISFEYIMLNGFNDSIAHAKELVKLVEGISCKFNLIPYNETSFSSYQATPQEKIDVFRDILMRAGITCITRRKRGEDIRAACGQLVI